MPRAKRGNKRLEKRKKILALAKGYRGTKSKLYRSAKESVERALNFAYTGRKLKKRDFRKLWIVRINGTTSSIRSSFTASTWPASSLIARSSPTSP
jgi:large subunit ribosomal protein L20